MAVNFHMLTLKLLKAIRVKHKTILLYCTEQKIGENTGNVYTEHRLYLGMTTEQFNAMHPNDIKNPAIHKSRYARELLIRTVKQEELFKYLLEEIWKPLESGEMYEKGRRAAERIRSRYYANSRKGRSGSAGVLQDASISKELPGGISGGSEEDGHG